MTSSSSDIDGKSWAQIASSGGSELRFVEAVESIYVEDVLQIPQSVIDIGIKRLESAVVAQFVRMMPPIKVISSILNRLWGFGEVVHVSLLSPRFILVELPSMETCDWILTRSWHMHPEMEIRY
ncbi:hypothetical protein LINPERHAP1_LOCUS17755 [Linum perenne]